jgi:hypothetical protein
MFKEDLVIFMSRLAPLHHVHVLLFSHFMEDLDLRGSVMKKTR